jgi:3-dehydroquinate dehydratase
MSREPWRHVSVLADNCVASVSGKGVEGYREALVTLRQVLRPS